MKKTLELPDTIEACHEIIISQARIIAVSYTHLTLPTTDVV